MTDQTIYKNIFLDEDINSHFIIGLSLIKEILEYGT